MRDDETMERKKKHVQLQKKNCDEQVGKKNKTETTH